MEFWGFNFTNETKSETVEIPEQVILNVTGVALDQKSEAPVTVSISYNNNKFTLCTLKWGTVFQQSVDVRFSGGSAVTFESTGACTMTGFWSMEPEDFSDEEGMYSLDENENEEDSQSVSEETLPPPKVEKRQMPPTEETKTIPQKQKKTKTENVTNQTPATLPEVPKESPKQKGGKPKQNANTPPNQPKKGGNPNQQGGKKGGNQGAKPNQGNQGAKPNQGGKKNKNKN